MKKFGLLSRVNDDFLEKDEGINGLIHQRDGLEIPAFCEVPASSAFLLGEESYSSVFSS